MFAAHVVYESLHSAVQSDPIDLRDIVLIAGLFWAIWVTFGMGRLAARMDAIAKTYTVTYETQGPGAVNSGGFYSEEACMRWIDNALRKGEACVQTAKEQEPTKA